jgi:hypothetical protein
MPDTLKSARTKDLDDKEDIEFMTAISVITEISSNS